jgi:hypothetical protein
MRKTAQCSGERHGERFVGVSGNAVEMEEVQADDGEHARGEAADGRMGPARD